MEQLISAKKIAGKEQEFCTGTGLMAKYLAFKPSTSLDFKSSS